MSKGNGTLPTRNEFGYYEIRMESVGGLGANVAAKILAEAIVLGQGFNAVNFATYGSEKQGTPVKGFVRISDSDGPIRINSPVEEPDLLAIFHLSLARVLPVTAGVKPRAIVVVNTNKSPDEARDLLRLHAGTVACIDAIKIEIEEKSRVNMAMLGAMTKCSGFIDAEAVKEAIRSAFERKYPATIPFNIKAFDRAQNDLVVKRFDPDGKYPYVPFSHVPPALGWKNAPPGGAITDFANSLLKDNSGSRVGYVPVYHRDKCIDCAQCEMTCPDYCFVWREGLDKKGQPAMQLLGINYQYCKGCLRCVEVCPVEALTQAIEAEVNVEEMSRKLQQELGAGASAKP